VKACCTPISKIRNQVEPKVSDGIVWSVSTEAGYHGWVALKVPYLTKQHKRARISWGQSSVQK